MPSQKSKSTDLNYLNDEKIAKGQKAMMEKTNEWKGGSHKERQEQQKQSKREIQKAMAKANEKVSWKKKAGAIGAVVFMCGAGLCQFLATVFGFIMGNGIVNVDATDTAKLKEVLFSGEPWLVYCVNNETQSNRLPRVLEDSASGLSSSLGMRTAVLPCWDQTASGRSVAQRFKLSLKPPLSFVVANGNKPRLLNLAGVSKYEELEKKVKPALKTETYRIDTLKKWGSLCTSRKTCVVIGHKNTAQRDYALGLFKPLLDKFRSTKIVTLDTSFWQLKLDDGVLATRSSDKSRGKTAEVLCLVREDSASGEKGNSTHSGTFLGALDASSADAFMKACEDRSGLVQLEKVPKINARPSKPKKVSAPTPVPRPTPSPAKPREAAQGNVDRVGSRDRMESEEPLFEAVEEDEQGEGDGEEDESEEDEEEVEL